MENEWVEARASSTPEDRMFNSSRQEGGMLACSRFSPINRLKRSWSLTTFPFRSCRREAKDFSRRQTLPFQCRQSRIGRRMQSDEVSLQCLRPIVRKGGISQQRALIPCKNILAKEFNSHLINRLWATFCLDIFTQYQQAPTKVSVLLDHSPLSGLY